MRYRSGFSLVELSIVLVILGLLTGGILAGQSLIRAAELRKVGTQFQAHQTAIHTFRDKYFSLPGDMTNATDFWGEIDASKATCIATASPDRKATCNGDGDGFINKSDTYADQGYERYHGWLQLANAGLIEGSYTGLTGIAGTFKDVAGENTPFSPFPTYPWHMTSRVKTAIGHPHLFDGRYNEIVNLTTRGSGGPLTPEELWNIDKKLDDGKPATGILTTYKQSSTWAPGCANGDTVNAEYNLQNSAKVCGFVGKAL